jgi:hypothetical protein
LFAIIGVHELCFDIVFFSRHVPFFPPRVCLGPMCRNPILRRVRGWDSHSRNWDVGVLHDSQKFRVQLKGSKILALRHFLYHWKAIEV